MDLTFEHFYDCTQLREAPQLPRPIPHYYYYPRGATQGGKDGILLEIRPLDGEPWLGTFAFGNTGPKGISGVFTTPDPCRICVVAKGNGYLVHVNRPTSWEPVQLIPVIDARPVLCQELLILADFTHLIAYGQTGLKWKTARLTWDDLKITKITDTFLEGEFWDIRTEAKRTFTVDLTSGIHEGGIGKD